MDKRWFIGLCFVMVFSLLLGGCQNRPTAEEIVAKMKEVEASIENAHAVAEFSVQAQGMAMDAVVEMWEKSPNKLRAQVLEASEDDLLGIVSVTDGQQVWIYNPSENETLVGRVGELGMDEPLDPRRMIELMEEGIQSVLDTCDVELVGEEDVGGAATYKLEFTPREGEETSLPLPIEGKVTLWVEQERWIALQAHFDGGSMGEGWAHVRSFEFNEGVADDRFQFEIPTGAHVINVEELQPTPLTLDEARAQAGFTLLVPGYVPDGVTLIDVFTVEGAFVLHYDHSTVSFTIMQRLSQEAEELEQKLIEQRLSPGIEELEVTVRGQTATLIIDRLDNSFLTWTEDGIVINIAGRISQDEILKVAESLQ
jgi:outer membrane lipoprotein-sorting protein